MNDYRELIEILKIRSETNHNGNWWDNAVADDIDRAIDAIEQLVKERDSAIKDMYDYQGSFCCYCKRNNTEECLFPEEVLLMCGKFAWRGVQE